MHVKWLTLKVFRTLNTPTFNIQTRHHIMVSKRWDNSSIEYAS